ncbi:succinate--CoA ligase [Helicobacter saguini]|uniref:1,4-dihydroxy-6-naphtoate synthase n=1 Tax=Helicobacter saguini TaxID=1548018 RepID=A0A347VTJ0_9HELI|nr:succinate--CoA ligase [Helicobacter saguini]MWV69606.1 succinate--CoA ligase [Helicobacter saguini]MWV70844.1 succinate--CoA ligase [Helicobacter saguini]TLD94319.1 succinate--CoA ligase [Helicobacter saguini]
MQTMKNNAYTIAHSPDADDIFMYYAIKFGWVSSPYPLQNFALDIESLNQSCLSGEYDICAISFGLYPHICESYALLRTAMSFGNGYGPKVIKKKQTQLKRNFKVALSGKYTTNALLFLLKYPNARPVFMNFMEIQKAVLSGECDAGVLIHEEILNFSSELVVEAFLWDIWQELSGENALPLPLGGMALRRSIPLNRAINLEQILTRAIEIGLKYKKTLSQMLLQNHLVRVNENELSQYLDLYANKDSVTMSEVQKNALEKLYEIGYNARIYNRDLSKNLEKYLIPIEYEKIRNS